MQVTAAYDTKPPQVSLVAAIPSASSVQSAAFLASSEHRSSELKGMQWMAVPVPLVGE